MKFSGESIRNALGVRTFVGFCTRKIHAICLLAAVAGMQLAAGAMPARGPQTSGSVSTARIEQAVHVLQQWYIPETGLYRTTGWWNSANAITTLANYGRISQSRELFPLFSNTLSAAQHSPDGFPGFINRYYDDEGWWALAWIDVYDLTRDARYLEQAKSIFADMQLGWDTAACGGGVWWSKDKKDKNAIENELFLAVAASLANRETDANARRGDLSWARKEWSWFLRSGMINNDHLVNDGLDLSNPAQCGNNGKETWTYNQGVILGALVELNEADPDPERLKLAGAIASAAIQHLTDANGVLHEPGYVHGGGDVPQFKGIFARNLMTLNEAHPDGLYSSFIGTNAGSILSQNVDQAGHFGFSWAGPFDSSDAARQISALDALVAAYAIGNQNGKQRNPAGEDTAVPQRRPWPDIDHVVDVVYLGDSITQGVQLSAPESQAPPVMCTASLKKRLAGTDVYGTNEGRSGHTTVDFLPETRTDFPKVELAARESQSAHPGLLVFSIMLGTNDSAERGPNGSPVSPAQYGDNLRAICQQLLHDFPHSIVVIHHPLWYSPNTHNGCEYGDQGLSRLKSYFPIIDETARSFEATTPGRVFLGDTSAFGYFEANYHDALTPEAGHDGTFYLHPNADGAMTLGDKWASAITDILRGNGFVDWRE